MKLKRVVAWLLCGAPLVLAADSPAPQFPAHTDADTRSVQAASADDSDSTTPQEREWERVESWMKEHCPNRVRFLHLIRVASRQDQARKMMIERYNQIQRVQFKPLREALIRELEAQDQIFGAQIEMRQAGRRRDTTLQSTADADLRTGIDRLFDAQQARRRARLQQLKEETKRIGDEVERQDRLRNQLVETWFNNMKSNAARTLGGRPQNAAPDDTTRPSEEK